MGGSTAEVGEVPENLDVNFMVPSDSIWFRHSSTSFDNRLSTLVGSQSVKLRDRTHGACFLGKIRCQIVPSPAIATPSKSETSGSVEVLLLCGVELVTLI